MGITEDSANNNEKLPKKKTAKDNVHKGHRDRVRSRFMKSGGDSFADHELLELLLFYSVPMKDTNALAHRLINEFGSFNALLEADPSEIERTCKISQSSAILIALQRYIGTRYIQSRWDSKTAINSIKLAKEYCATRTLYRDRECFIMICLDNQHRVLHDVLVSEGTINQSIVPPRLVVESALRYQAASVIFTHNHPGGTNQPSQADIELTTFLANFLEVIEVRVIEHIIVGGDGSTFSFRENKLLNDQKKQEPAKPLKKGEKKLKKVKQEEIEEIEENVEDIEDIEDIT